jgi:hypothetical protein
MSKIPIYVAMNGMMMIIMVVVNCSFSSSIRSGSSSIRSSIRSIRSSVVVVFVVFVVV